MNTRRWFLSLLPASLAGWFAKPQATIDGANELSVKIEGDVDERAKELVKGLIEPLAAELKECAPYYVDAAGKKHFPPPGETFTHFETMPVLPEGLRWHSLAMDNDVKDADDRRAWSITITWRPDLTDDELAELWMSLDEQLRHRPWFSIRTLFREIELRVHKRQIGDGPVDWSEEARIQYENKLKGRFEDVQKIANAERCAQDARQIPSIILDAARKS